MPKFHFAEESHVYTLEGVTLPHVTGILDAIVSTAVYPPGPHRVIGKQVHKATELFDLGQAGNYEFGPTIEGYLASWRRMYTDLPFTWGQIEVSTYDPKLLVAGTVDRVGILRGQPAVLDLKTGSLDERKTALQTAAYTLMLFPDHPEQVLRYGVELDKNGGDPRVFPFEDRYDLEGWRGVVAFYKWQRRKAA